MVEILKNYPGPRKNKVAYLLIQIFGGRLTPTRDFIQYKSNLVTYVLVILLTKQNGTQPTALFLIISYLFKKKFLVKTHETISPVKSA